MAKKKLKQEVLESRKSKPIVFKDPSETLWGKIVIGVIIFGTVATVLISTVFALIEYFG
ncbi:hypothetical protein [Acholeplasma hippikon]|uniref:Uncharacterized protein n=1 Tax=Acholeplasma hippikon TaxID=264636 RepID=A0A449BIB4_9MOLU|nr:hypothetical protein [Acholeplasma hippikon]VEU82180.1 Uncharacterised protein [Acholeplasma hippikon]